MRQFILLLFAVPIYAQPLLVPLAPDRPVADVVRGGAAGNQINPLVATNGDMSLVAWLDDRDVARAVYVARVDGAGNVLDPSGVRVSNVLPNQAVHLQVTAVVWNGQSFVVVILNGYDLTSDFVFVTPDMRVTTKHVSLADYRLVAITPGPNVRFFYVRGTVPTVAAAVLDGNANVVVAKDLWTSADPAGVAAASATATGFLLLRQDHGSLIAVRTDRDANILSTHPSGLVDLTDWPISTVSMAGSDDGFLLAKSNRSGVIAYPLDRDGVYTGQSITLDTDAAMPVSMTREESRYVLAWETWTETATTQAIATVGVDRAVSVQRLTVGKGWHGATREPGGNGLASHNGRRVLVTSADRDNLGDLNVVFRALSPALDAAEPRMITTTADRQGDARIASGVNGYAVVWSEIGADSTSRIYVRRFSEVGVPQDPAPVDFGHPASFGYLVGTEITSNGETYLVGCPTGDDFLVRRLSARTGAWLDPAPLPLGMVKGEAVHLASNGTDAIALAAGFLTTRFDSGVLRARRINLSGPALTSPIVTLKSFEGTFAFAESGRIESNGSDYLAVWMEDALTGEMPLPISDRPLFALRLHSNGTPIDAAPVRLNASNTVPTDVAVSYAAGRYLVSWTAGSRAKVLGTRVLANGSVLDGNGVSLAEIGPNDLVTAFSANLQNRFVLLQFHWNYDVSLADSTAEAVTFEPTAELSRTASLPRTVIGTGIRALAGATHGSVLAVVYSRIEEGEAGGVERVFLRLLFDSTRRARAVGR